MGITALLLVRQLDPAVKESLRRRAQRHGRSMEDETGLCSPGLGSRMAALFSEAGLEEPIPEWRGVESVPAPFEP